MKIGQFIRNTDKFLATLILYMLLITTVAQVIMRSVFSLPLIGAEELARYFFICIVFIALPYTTRSGGLIRLKGFQSLFPKRLKYILRIISYGFGIAVFGIIAASSISSTLNNIGNQTPTLALPFWLFFLPTMVGFSLLTIEYIVLLINFLKRPYDGLG